MSILRWIAMLVWAVALPSTVSAQVFQESSVDFQLGKSHIQLLEFSSQVEVSRLVVEANKSGTLPNSNEFRSLPIARQMFNESSLEAYRVLLGKVTDSTIAHFPELYRQQLIASWRGEIGPSRVAELEVRDTSCYSLRQATNHFELVWNAGFFELRQYRDLDKRARKCSPQPAVLTEVIKLRPIVTDRSLTLVPAECSGLLTYYVVVDFEGTVETKLCSR